MTHVTGLKNGPNDAPNKNSQKRTGKQANRFPQTTNNWNLVLCVEVEPLLEIQILVSIPGRNCPG